MTGCRKWACSSTATIPSGRATPQQYALNKSLKEPVIKNADWVIHIDVDEFINIRCGNGRLEDFFERVPDATNVAMTWRLFGHNGVTELNRDLVIEQFDDAALNTAPSPTRPGVQDDDQEHRGL